MGFCIHSISPKLQSDQATTKSNQPNAEQFIVKIFMDTQGQYQKKIQKKTELTHHFYFGNIFLIQYK